MTPTNITGPAIKVVITRIPPAKGLLTNRELEGPMPLEPATHERPCIPREQCSSRKEEQEPKDAEHSMSNNQLLVWLEWD